MNIAYCLIKIKVENETTPECRVSFRSKEKHYISFYLINLRVIPFYNRATPVFIRIRME